MGNIRTLEDELTKALGEYEANVKFALETSENDEGARNDLEEISRQVFYVLDSFKDGIVNYLKSI